MGHVFFMEQSIESQYVCSFAIIFDLFVLHLNPILGLWDVRNFFHFGFHVFFDQESHF